MTNFTGARKRIQKCGRSARSRFACCPGQRPTRFEDLGIVAVLRGGVDVAEDRVAEVGEVEMQRCAPRELVQERLVVLRCPVR